MNAQEMDKKVALEQFLGRIREHTVDDLRGVAHPSISQMLRTEAAYSAWRNEISKIIQTGGPLATMAQRRVGEMRELGKRYNAKKLERYDLNGFLTDAFGEAPPVGINLDGVLAWGIGKVFIKLRAIEAALSEGAEKL